MRRRSATEAALASRRSIGSVSSCLNRMTDRRVSMLFTWAPSRRVVPPEGGGGGEVLADRLQRACQAPGGPGLDDHVAEGGGLHRPGEHGEAGGVSGELAEQLVL